MLVGAEKDKRASFGLTKSWRKNVGDLARLYNTLHHKISAEKERSIAGRQARGKDDMKGSTVQKLQDEGPPLPLGQAGGLIILLTLATEALLERVTTWALAFANNARVRAFVFSRLL